jgi:hypothetical protein
MLYFCGTFQGMADRFSFRTSLLRLVLPLIYAGFFVVQGFIHFDSAVNVNSGRYRIMERRANFNLPMAIRKTKGNHPLKTKFRLNKRFQPADIPALPNINLEPLLSFITIQRVNRVNPFVDDPLRDAPLLRGPPDVA